MTQQILIISDAEPHEALRCALDAKGFNVAVAEDADQGYRRLIETQFDLVVLNLDKAISGAGLIKRIRSNRGLSGLLVLTVAQWGTGQATISLAQGADGFEPKPVEADRLVEAIEKLLWPDRAMTASVGPARRELEF